MFNDIDKKILKLAAPNIISNISIPLLSTVDTVLMGRLSILHLASIGVGSMIFNMLYWNFGFLRMGTTGAVAQAYGADNRKEISLSLARGLLLGVFISIIILLFSTYLLKISNSIFHVSSESVSYVKDYFNVRIWAAPATLMLYVLLGWLFGMQNAIYPLIITIFINILNIVSSYYCVEVLKMETKGVAIGTVIAQYAGLIFALGLILIKYKDKLERVSSALVLNISELRQFFSINVDIFIRTFCLTFVFSFFYSQSFKLGAMVMAVNVILQQFINWMSYIIDGFAYASESLVGRYYGSKESENLKQVTIKSFIWGGAVACFCTLCFSIFGDQMIQLFSKELDVILKAKEIYYFVLIFPMISFASYIWDGICIGLLASRSMRNSMLLALSVFLISYYMQLPKIDGSHIWIALCCFMLARGVFQTYIYMKSGMDMD